MKVWRAAALMALMNSQFAAGAETPPNIVIVFIDDMGYADIGPFGSPAGRTPNLDRLAKEGRTLTNFYVSTAVCSASRASLLTGCYNLRVGIKGALNDAARIGINTDETTIAEICKQQGYATAIFGKWHLGHHEKFLPAHHGFDEYFGLPYSNDMWPFHPESKRKFPDLPLFEGTQIVDASVTAEDQETLTKRYTEKAVDFIRRNRDKPFFLYVPHSMVHVPLFASEQYRGKTGAGLYADVVAEVDWSVGQIADAIRENRLDQKTILLFTSDNGPWLSYGDHAGSARPFREGKGTIFEGGVRVPAVAWGPGRIPAGTKCDEPMMTIDVLPTVAKLTGGALPGTKIDGKDIWPLLAEEPGAKSPHAAYHFYWDDQLEAVRMGKWKLHFPHGFRTLAGNPGGTGGKPTQYRQAKIGLSLFDLETDPGETTDVAGQYPQVVAEIEKLADAMRSDLGDSARNMQGSGRRPAGQL